MVSTMIVGMNILIALSMLGLFLAMAWRGGRRAWTWPVSGYIAIGGLFLLTATVIAQWSLWRVWGNDAVMFGYSGWGTFVIRVALLVASLALARRVVTGSIMTHTDRERVRDP